MLPHSVIVYEIILAGFKFGNFPQNRQFAKLKLANISRYTVVCTLYYCRYIIKFTPSKQLQVQVHVVPVEKGGGAGAEGGGSGDANEGEEPPRKRAKVMLLQVMRKGMQIVVKWSA